MRFFAPSRSTLLLSGTALALTTCALVLLARAV
jgi:hypothetical protein